MRVDFHLKKNISIGKNPIFSFTTSKAVYIPRRGERVMVNRMWRKVRKVMAEYTNADKVGGCIVTVYVK